METPLLRTKLYIPPPRPDLVLRPRLIERLNEGLRCKLTLISAPAGFGKTTLVGHWIQQLKQPATWLSLDENDTSPLRFFTYFIAAIRSIYPEVAQTLAASLNSSNPPDAKAITPALLNELSSANVSLVIVLDDYHLIQNSMVHQALAFFVDYLPPDIHLVLTSRADPPLPLPRWRVRGQIDEIQASDLRFTLAETSAFLAGMMKLHLDEEAVSSLERRTEGWIAGLQLAALSLRNLDDPTVFIRNFTGGDRQVADYLLQEVWYRQTEEIQQFLLQTSILERFNAPLCNSLLGQEDSQEILERLEQANLFIVPLDNQRYWYRYHHLFAQLLQQRLHRDRSEASINQLHFRAAQWYYSAGYLEEAIHHAFQIPDFDFAAQVIASVAVHSLWEHGGAGLMKQWTERLPISTIQQYPRVVILAAAAHLITGDPSKSATYLRLVEADESVRPEWELLQAVLVRNQGDYVQGLKLAQRSFETLRADDKTLRALAQMQIAVNFMVMGKLDEAESVLQTVQQGLLATDPTDLSFYLEAIHLRACIAIDWADLYRAERLYRASLTLVEENGQSSLPMIGLMVAGLGGVYYQWNEMGQATACFDQTMTWGNSTGIWDILAQAYFGQCKLACWEGNRLKAAQVIDQLRNVVQRSKFSEAIRDIERYAATSYLKLGELSSAVRWANASGLSINDVPRFDRCYDYQTLAAVRLAESRALGQDHLLPGILTLVERLIEIAAAAHHRFNLIENLILKALILDLQDNIKAALGVLQQAFELAEPGSLIRVFLDFGPPLQALLFKAEKAEMVHPTYVRRLLQAFAQEPLAPSAAPQPAPSLHLTRRESEVLQQIVVGLSNKEIEEKLVVSRNTVRTHIKNLYSKLGVQNRAQAIKKAHELNLV